MTYLRNKTTQALFTLREFEILKKQVPLNQNDWDYCWIDSRTTYKMNGVRFERKPEEIKK